MDELNEPVINDEELEKFCEKLKSDAAEGGYNLNPDDFFTVELARGLMINEKRYGYQSCPCRLASGVASEDLDIVCPCDYRDPDIAEYGACYCALYVNDAIAKGEEKAKPLPDRREEELAKKKEKKASGALGELFLSQNVWRCKVCGYLCARETPPEKCPICKVSKERFELFITKGDE